MAYALKLAEHAEETGEEITILVNLSGRGDKDVTYVRNILGDLASEDPATTTVTNPKVAEVLDAMTLASNAQEGVGLAEA